jgi:alpha-beta hydrolase superfamily lysophospholipase
MHTVDDQLLAADGERLFARRWLPEGETRADIVLLHGLAEHSGRYEHVAEFLTDRGYAIHTFDGRGHGRTPGHRGFIPSLADYQRDIAACIGWAQPAGSSRPLFLMGHSMGGGLAAVYALENPDELDGLILSSAALAPGEDFSPLLITLVNLLARLAPRLPTVELESAGLSRDPAVVEAYDRDPLNVRGRLPARTGAVLAQMVSQIQARMEELSVPFLAIHGTADPLTDPQGSKDVYSRAAAGDKTLKLFEGFYHETFNEPEKEQVLAFIADWLDTRSR